MDYRRVLKDIEAFLAEHGLRIESYRPGRERLYQVVERREGGGVIPLTRYMTFSELVAWAKGFEQGVKAPPKLQKAEKKSEGEVYKGVKKLSPYEWLIFGRLYATVAVFMDCKIPEVDMAKVSYKIQMYTKEYIRWVREGDRVYILVREIRPYKGEWDMYGVWKGAEKVADLGVVPEYAHAVIRALEDMGYTTAKIGRVRLKEEAKPETSKPGFTTGEGKWVLIAIIRTVDMTAPEANKIANDIAKRLGTMAQTKLTEEGWAVYARGDYPETDKGAMYHVWKNKRLVAMVYAPMVENIMRAIEDAFNAAGYDIGGLAYVRWKRR